MKNEMRTRCLSDHPECRRLGKFYIGSEMLAHPDLDKIFEQIKLVPIQVQATTRRGTFEIEYVGLSPLFKLYHESTEAMTYELQVEESTIEDGSKAYVVTII